MHKWLSFVDYFEKKRDCLWNKWTKLILPAILLFSAVWYGGNYIKDNFGNAEEAAVQTMEQVSFLKKEASISAEYDSSAVCYGEDVQWKILYELAAAMQLEEPLDKREVRTEAGTSLSLIKDGARSQVILKFLTLNPGETEENSLQYLFVNLELQGNFEDALYYKEELGQVLQSRGLSAELSMDLKGVMEFEGTEEERTAADSWGKSLLKQLNAEIVFENNSEGINIIYAYCPWVEDVIATDQGAVNLNLIRKELPMQKCMEIRVSIPASLPNR